MATDTQRSQSPAPNPGLSPGADQYVGTRFRVDAVQTKGEAATVICHPVDQPVTGQQYQIDADEIRLSLKGPHQLLSKEGQEFYLIPADAWRQMQQSGSTAWTPSS